MFERKTRDNLSETLLNLSTLGRLLGFCMPLQANIRLARDKHSSLLDWSVSDEEEQLYNIGTSSIRSTEDVTTFQVRFYSILV